MTWRFFASRSDASRLGAPGRGLRSASGLSGNRLTISRFDASSSYQCTSHPLLVPRHTQSAGGYGSKVRVRALRSTLATLDNRELAHHRWKVRGELDRGGSARTSERFSEVSFEQKKCRIVIP